VIATFLLGMFAGALALLVIILSTRGRVIRWVEGPLEIREPPEHRVEPTPVAPIPVDREDPKAEDERCEGR